MERELEVWLIAVVWMAVDSRHLMLAVMEMAFFLVLWNAYCLATGGEVRNSQQTR